MVGLSPVTLMDYCQSGRSTLIRGTDFTVRRSSPYRKHIMFTDAGIARLIARDYRTTQVDKRTDRRITFKGKPAPLESLSVREARMRLRHNIAVAFQKYLELGGCAVPGCPCVIHQSPILIPQATYIRAILHRPTGGESP